MILPRLNLLPDAYTMDIRRKGGFMLGRTKLGNRNAQANNNAKKKNGFQTHFDSYAGREAEKLIASNKRHND
ncbi:YpzF [Bacillus stercoris]